MRAFVLYVQIKYCNFYCIFYILPFNSPKFIVYIIFVDLFLTVTFESLCKQDKVGSADAQIDYARELCNIAASSHTRRDSASETPALTVAAAALTDELFLNCKDCLLSTNKGYFNQLGKASYINFIFLIIFIATY